MTTSTLIFDLDHTVIDSSHRQLTKPDGSLDISHWLENSTREKIFGDTLMPLASYMRSVYGVYRTIVCTSRTMQQHDFDYLDHHGLKFDRAYYRKPGDNTPDGPFKRSHFMRMRLGLMVPFSEMVLFDDNDAVRAEARRLGITAYHPNEVEGVLT